MRKSVFLKLCMLLVVASMVLSLFACNDKKPEVTTDAPTDAPTEAPTQEPTEAPTQAPTEAPTQAPTEAPTQAPTEAPTQAPTEAPVDETTEAPVDETTEAPVDETTEAPVDETTEAPVDETTEAPVDETTEAPVDETTEAPVDETTEAPVDETTEAPVDETTEAPVDETTEAPVEETTEAPAEETTEAPEEETTEGPSCDEGHTYEVALFDGVWKKVCTVCGDVEYDYDVSEEAAGVFLSPEYLFGLATSETATGITGKMNGVEIRYENGMPYFHMGDNETNHAPNGAWNGWQIYDKKDAPNAGQYLAIKVRRPESSLDIDVLSFWIISNASYTNTWAAGGFTVPLSEGDEWHTIIIDLAKVSSAFAANEDGTYGVRSIHMRPFNSGSQCDATTDEAFDIAYIAFFDSMDDIKGIVKDATYELNVNSSTNVEYNVDGTKVACKENDHATGDAVITDGENGTKVYTYKCMKCDTEFTRTVPVNALFIDPAIMASPSTSPDNFHPNTMFQMTSVKSAFNGQYPYFGFKGTSASNKTAQFIWNRAAEDITSASAHERYTIEVGEAKYFVIKARANIAASGALKIYFSTVGAKYSAISFPYDDYKGDWVTYVVDLETVMADYWIKNADGGYTLDTFYFHMYDFLANDSLDIEYMAFVGADWADVDALVEEEQVFNVTDKSGAGKWISVADGGEVEAPTEEETTADPEEETTEGEEEETTEPVPTCDGSEHGMIVGDSTGHYAIGCTICGIADGPKQAHGSYNVEGSLTQKYISGASYYTHVCAACGYAVEKVELPDAVTYYFAGVSFVNTAVTYFQTGAKGVKFDGEMAYGSISGADKVAQILWQRSRTDTSNTSIGQDFENDIGNAKYLVIKLRTNNKAQGIALTMSSTGKNGLVTLNFPMSKIANDTWTVLVIDLEKALGDYFAKDANTDTYRIDTFYFHLEGFASTTSIDVAYMAYVDGGDNTWAAIDSVVDEAQVLYMIDKTGSAGTLYTETGKCVGAHLYGLLNTVTEADTVEYVYGCTVCGAEATTTKIPANVNWYASLSDMGVYSNTGSIEKNVFEDGVIFNRYTLTGGCHLNITGGGAAGSPTSATYPTGKYIVFKYRANAGTIGFNAATGDKKSGNGKSAGTQSAANAPSDWRVAVLDLSANAQWTSDGSAQKIYVMLTTGSAGTLDIAYTAVVDTLVEARALIAAYDADDTSFIYYGTNFAAAGSEISTATGTCVNNHAYVARNVDGVCRYICDGCGNDGGLAEHTYLKVDDAADARGYHYECKLCGKKLSIDFYTQNVKGYSANTAYKTEISNGVDKTGFTYKSVNVTGTTGDMLNFMSSQYYGGDVNMYSPTAVMAGRYIVIKLKGTVPAGGSLPICVGTEDSGVTGGKNPKQSNIGKFTSDNMPSDWEVIVVDLKNVEKYSDGTVQKIACSTAEGDGGLATSGVKFDLAYIIFVSDLADLNEFVTESEYRFYDGKISGAGAYVYTATGKCKNEHSYEPQVVDGACTNVCKVCGNVGGAAEHTNRIVADGDAYVLKCAICSTVAKTYAAKPSATALYMPAEDLINRFTSTLDGSSWTGKFNSITLQTENGESFVRLSDMETNKAASGAWGGWFMTGQGSGSGTKYAGVGQYLVLKVRNTNTFTDKGLNRIDFWITSAGSSVSWATGSFQIPLPADGAWHTVVIDLAVRASSGFTVDSNGEYGPRTVHMRPWGGGSSVDGVTNESFDIAYMAFFKDLNELKNVIGEATYEWNVSNGSNQSKKTADHTCAVHSATESVSGSTYTYTCTICGVAQKTITLPDSVKMYYSANDLATTANVYYSGSKAYGYDDAEKTGYYDCNGVIQTIFQRMDHDMGATQTAGDPEQFTENVGNAKYLVVKARSSDANAYLRFVISTTAKNCDVVTITEADFVEGVLDKTKATYRKILADGSTDAETKCSAVGDQYYNGNPMKSVYFMGKGQADGKWTTYVIDLEAVCGEYYAKAEGQDYYDVDTFYFHNEGNSEIAYAAFVEGDWSAIDALVEETEVIEITEVGTSAARVGTVVKIADKTLS